MRAPAEERLLPKLRAVVKDDWAYILDSWKKSYRELGSEQHVPKHIYWPEQHARIEYLRMDPKVEFRIAADPEDPDFIWGWACVEGPVLHYVFVRASAQGQGVAKLLLRGLPVPLVCTHWTKVAEAVASKQPGRLLFEPSRRKK
jgi:GNAT superfamily N-acetyltransferase